MATYNDRMLTGDALTTLQTLLNTDTNKYRLIVTSPPYYKHRNYGSKKQEIGQETTSEEYIDNLVDVFTTCKDLLTEDGSLFIVIGDTRRNNQKLLLPHRLALALKNIGYYFQEDIIWYKKNAISSSSKTRLNQAYEYILFLSKNQRPFLNMDPIRTQGNEVLAGKNKIPLKHMLQFTSINRNIRAIDKLKKIIHNSTSETPVSKLPTTEEIAWAYGYDPEKYCPTCHRKLKRHATRRRFGGHKHYPIFAVCNPKGKTPINVWEISTKAHHGNEHFAMFPEDLVSKIIKFTTERQDFVLDPFAGRGTTGIVATCLERHFTGIDLYSENVKKIRKNITDARDMKLPQKILNQIKNPISY